MKLKALRIDHHPTLGTVDIHWEAGKELAGLLSDASPLLMLVGENGSGKTTLLTTLATIFWDLFRRSSASFAYRLVYEIGDRDVIVEAKEAGAAFNTLFPSNDDATEPPLPKRLYAMTSGDERVWQIGENADDESRGRWLLLKRTNQPLLTLAALLDHCKQPSRPFGDILRMARISHLHGFSLTIPTQEEPTHFRVSDLMERLRRSALRCVVTPASQHLYFQRPDTPEEWADAILDHCPATFMVEELNRTEFPGGRFG